MKKNLRVGVGGVNPSLPPQRTFPFFNPPTQMVTQTLVMYASTSVNTCVLGTAY